MARKFKLGWHPGLKDPRTLKLSSYLKDGALPEIPAKVDWISKVYDWGMMKNDVIGDCTCAGFAHLIQGWSAANGKEVVIPDAEVIAEYSAVSGYNPANNTNDNGATCLDVLKLTTNQGFVGHKIAAFVEIDPKNLDHVREAIYLFGGVYTGLEVPSDIDERPGAIWNVKQLGGPIDGGHCVPIMGFDRSVARFSCVSWGDRYDMTEYFFRTYFKEVWAVISLDWVAPDTLAPNSFNLAQLLADKQALS